MLASFVAVLGPVLLLFIEDHVDFRTGKRSIEADSMGAYISNFICGDEPRQE